MIFISNNNIIKKKIVLKTEDYNENLKNIYILRTRLSINLDE